MENIESMWLGWLFRDVEEIIEAERRIIYYARKRIYRRKRTDEQEVIKRHD
jgi:hypothetical protein